MSEKTFDFQAKDPKVGTKIALRNAVLVLESSKINRSLSDVDISLLADTNLEHYPYFVDLAELDQAWQYLSESRRKYPYGGSFPRIIRDAGKDKPSRSLMNDMAFTGYRIYAIAQQGGQLTVCLECGTPWARGDSQTLWCLEFGVTTH